MFERPHHRDIALVLQSLDPEALTRLRCWFGGGTAMALRYGEYRESVDIDFLVSDRDGYRELRGALGGTRGLAAIVRPGQNIELAREMRADQYGIRTFVRAGGSLVKLEIVLEARIEIDAPGADDHVCGVPSLVPVDLAAEKLLANADRWADGAVFSRDLIDLAMQKLASKALRAACAKAEAAYGASVRTSVARSVEVLRSRPHRLGECMKALAMTSTSPAQLWQSIRRIERALRVAVS